MADTKTAAKTAKAPRVLGPRYMHLTYTIDDGKLANVNVVTNMEQLVEAIQGGKQYSKVELAARKPREQKAA